MGAGQPNVTAPRPWLLKDGALSTPGYQVARRRPVCSWRRLHGPLPGRHDVDGCGSAGTRLSAAGGQASAAVSASISSSHHAGGACSYRHPRAAS